MLRSVIDIDETSDRVADTIETIKISGKSQYSNLISGLTEVGLFKSIGYLSIKSLSYGIVLFSSFFAMVIAVYVLQLIPIQNEYISTFPLVLTAILLDIFICTAGILVWRLGQRMRHQVFLYWKAVTPPFEDPLIELLSNSALHRLHEAIRILFVDYLLIQKIPEPVGEKEVIKSTLGDFFFYNVYAIIGGAALYTVIDSVIGNSEVSITNSISVANAAISVLLGPLFGTLALGAFALSPDVNTILIIMSIIILPSLVAAPTANLLVRLTEQQMYSHITDDSGDVENKVQMILLLLMGVLIIVTVLILLPLAAFGGL